MPTNDSPQPATDQGSSQIANPVSTQITGLYETHLPVANLALARNFYQGILGLQLAHEIPDRQVAFLWVGSPESAMLGLWQTGSAPLGMRLHFAFRMPPTEILQLCGRLNQAGVQPLGFHGEAITEPIVIGWMPALSVYCKDPDGHSIEFIAKLPAPPKLNFGQGPYSAWIAQHG